MNDKLSKTENMNKQNSTQIAVEFQKELNSILDSKPPVSKDKMNQIVKEALKSHRYYKHVVYFVENFIKNCPPEYKVSGLYVIDAIIRNSQKTKPKPNSVSNHQQQKDLYLKRFAKNLTKTFTNLFNKANSNDHEKINRVIQLWQKYNIFEQDLIDKLNRLSQTSKLDSELNSSKVEQASTSIDSSNLDKLKQIFNKSLNQSEQNLNESLSNKIEGLNENLNLGTIKNLNSQIINELHKLTSKIITDNNGSSSAKKLRPSTPPLTSKTEINKILEFDNEFDSDSDNQSNLKRKSLSPLLSSSERFKTSISNCAAWLQSNINDSATSQQQTTTETNFKLPDLSQPPPPLLHNYQSFMYGVSGSGGIPPPPPSLPPPPPPPPVPPPPSLSSSNFKSESEQKYSKKEKEKERQRRGLPNIREKHICICSKTIWLGHLAKSTNEDILIDELTELLSPSSSNDGSSSNLKKKSSNKLSKNYQNIIVDVHLIPPRGCAFVEFIDRKTASKCLERMKDGYRLDGNYIKVAWATNKGINKDRRIKQYWNVEVGCTFIPWSDLDNYSTDPIDFMKWAEGGLVDEDSLPEKYLSIYKEQKLKLANSDVSNSKASSEVSPKVDNSVIVNNDMELDNDDEKDQSDQLNKSDLNQSIQQNPFQNLIPPTATLLPLNFQHHQAAAQGQANSNLQLPQLNSIHQFSGMNQSHIQLPTILTNQLHPISLAAPGSFPHLRPQLIQNSQGQFNPGLHTVIAQLSQINNSTQNGSNQSQTSQTNELSNENLCHQNDQINKQDLNLQSVSQNSTQANNGNLLLTNQLLSIQQQGYVDLLNQSHRNLIALRPAGFSNGQNMPQNFQFIQRPLLMGQTPSLLPMRNIILPLQTLQSGQAIMQNQTDQLINLNQQSIQQDSSTNEITSTTNLTGLNDDKNMIKPNEDLIQNDRSIKESNWNNQTSNNRNWRSNQNQRRSFPNDYSNRNNNNNSSKYNNNNGNNNYNQKMHFNNRNNSGFSNNHNNNNRSNFRNSSYNRDRNQSTNINNNEDKSYKNYNSNSINDSAND